MKIFTLLLCLLFIFSNAANLSFADDVRTTAGSSNAAVLLTPTPTGVEYQLPYPGLLPDNFFYKLKTLRDKVIEFLISDPLKKTEFDILQADKRYNAGLYLYHQSPLKEDIITSTFSKADNYMEEAVSQSQLAKKQGEDNKDYLGKILVSNQKHQEILNSIESTATPSLKKNLVQEAVRIEHIKSLVNTLTQHN